MNEMTLDRAIDILLEHENICNVCMYNDVCKGGVRGGPDGPIYPPCCDGGYEDCVYEDDAIMLAEDILNDEKEDL